MRLKKKRDFMARGGPNFERKWIKIALTDPFVGFGVAFLLRPLPSTDSGSSCRRFLLAWGKAAYS